MSAIGEWLKTLGLERYIDAFHANDIDIELLAEIDDQTLKDIGVASAGHRLRIKSAIAKLKSDRATSTAVDADASPSRTASSVDAERRQLTVMFCDLVGSTALSQTLDPELLRELMRAYQQACGAVIEKYAGHVAQYLGDGLMVYFGWPRAHEDDAERAVRAALEIVGAVKDVPAPQPLQVRIGIATGPVVVGETGAGDASVPKLAVGETPNLAARLQGLAGAEQIIIAPSTQRLVGAAFEYADLGRHTLKGIVEPVHAWRVIGVGHSEGRFEAARGALALTPLVGREEELGLLQRRWQQAKTGEGQVVLLGGEPGVGKSRITHALREAIEREAHLRLRYQCSPFHTQSALYPVIEQLERAAGLGAEDRVDDKLDKLEAVLRLAADESEIRSIAPLFAALLSLPAERYPPLNYSPQKQKELTLEALVSQVVGLARRQPVLMLFEDLHWSDPTTQEVLDLLVPRVAALPVLLLITHRPEYASHWSGEAHVSALGLSRLNRKLGAELATNISGGKTLPAAVLEQIVTKTDGVPLFVEELTKAVLESGIVRRSGQGYELTGPLTALAIPSTLQDSLMARLDRLSEVREVAQIGACIGREFAHDLLAAVSPLGDKELSQALQRLVDSELIYRRGSGYLFKHALVQDAAYASLLKSRRHQLHERIAHTLEGRPDVVERQPELIGHHFAQTGHHDKAAHYYEAAGNRALAAMAVAEAVNHFTQAIERLGQLPETEARDRTEARIRIALGSAFTAHKGWAAPEIAQALGRAYDLALKLDDEHTIIAAQAAMAMSAIALGDLERGDAIAGNLLQVGAARAHTRMLVVGHAFESWVAVAMGRLQDAVSNYESLLARYEREKHADLISILNHDPVGLAQSWVSVAYWILGRYCEGLAASQAQLCAARAIGHPWNLVWSLTGGSGVIAYLGDLNSAMQGIEEAKALCRKLHLDFGEQCVCAFHEGLMRIAGRDFARGAQAMEQGARLWASAGGNMDRTRGCTSLAEAHVALGRLDAAQKSIDEAAQLITNTGERFWEAEIHRVRGEIALLTGRGEAESDFRKALEVACSMGAKTFELRAATALARLWRSRCKTEEARKLLAPIHAWFTEGIETQDLSEAKALLQELEASA